MEFLTNINPALLVIITVVVTVALVKIASLVRSVKQKNQSYQEAIAVNWIRIRPIVSELVVDLINLNAQSNSFEAILNYSVKYIKDKVDRADWLLEDEKALLTEDLIRSVIEPHIKELYDKGALKGSK
jgi:hypothetical protein